MKFKKESFLSRASGFFLFCYFLSSVAFAYAADAPINTLGPFKKEDRIIVFAPHPDDETIGCAGVIQKALKAGSRVKVVYLTCGDNNIFSILFYNPFLFPLKLIFLRNTDFINLGKQRQKEAIKAMRILGLKEEDLIFLGYPDHGTDRMFVSCWGNNKSYHGMFSAQSAVPYSDSRSYKKEFKGDNILADLKQIILDYKPNKIFISHAADYNGDHWALYLYLQVVLADLSDEITLPQVFPYLVHVPRWPLPHYYHPELKLEPPGADFFGDLAPAVKWSQLYLTPQEIEKKHQAMLAYDSQTRISAFYLLSFVRQNELFSDIPIITIKRQSSLNTPLKRAGEYAFTSDNQWVSFAVVDDYLLLKAKKPEELKSRAKFLFFIAAYKLGVDFAQTPNIAIVTKYDKFTMYNTMLGEKPINPEGATLEFNPSSVVIKIPLSLLKNPDGFIFAANSLTGKFFPGGCASFHRVIIE